MADPFDVFELLAQDSVRWIGAARSLAGARAAIENAAPSTTDMYLILDRSTGQKVIFRVTKDGLVMTGSQPDAMPGRTAAA